MSRKWFWTSIGLGILMVLVNIWLFNGIPISLRISPETTVITEPTMDNGKFIDYARAIELLIAPPNMKTEENGYRLIVQKLGARPAGFDGTVHLQDYVLQTCEQLGLDIRDIERPLPYEEFESVLFAKRGTNNPTRINTTKIVSGQGTPEETQMVTDWLDVHSPALDVLVAAAYKPICRMPYCNSIQSPNGPTPLDYMQDVTTPRSWARVLNTRAQYRIGTGDFDGGYRDTIAILRLGRETSHGPTVRKLVGMATEGIALAIPLVGSATHQPTEHQIAQFQQELHNLPQGGDLATRMKTDHYSMLWIGQTICGQRTHKIPDYLYNGWDKTSTTGKMLFAMPVDANMTMKRINAHFTAIENGTFATTSSTPSDQMAETWGGVAQMMISRPARSLRLAEIIAWSFNPTVDHIREQEFRSLCTHHLKRITLAMLRYHARHGVFPPSRSENHSWRVLLLPYFDEPELTALAKQIRLDEPWDSKHNAQFLDKCPDVYRCPAMVHLGIPDSKTTYTVFIGDIEVEIEADENDVDSGHVDTVAIVGEDEDVVAEAANVRPPKTEIRSTLFDGSTVGNKPNDIRMNQILVGERTDAVDWMSPNEELSAQVAAELYMSRSNMSGPTNSWSRGGSVHSYTANFGYRNGSVRALTFSTSQTALKQLLTGVDWLD